MVMKRNNFFLGLGLAVAICLFNAACVQKNYYNANPNNNNNNNSNNNSNNSGYPNVFDEEFNNGDHYGWSFTSAADSAYSSISNGSYQYVDYSATQYNTTTVNTGNNVSGNFTVQTRIQSNNMMGLIFGAATNDNGYALYIDSLGNYSLYKEGIGSVATSVVIAPVQDTLYIIKKGWNTVEVDQISNTWTGYINGTQVFSIPARPIAGSNFGFKVAPATIGYADYLIVKSN
jgi:hypothetical protein